LILQDLSRTLVDEEVEELIQRVVSRLASKFGATLRT
jgi:phenylalanyl-tRNA synthetase beta subunit